MNRTDTNVASFPLAARPSRREQAGKVGMALLAWMLGVPGSLVLLYLIFF